MPHDQGSRLNALLYQAQGAGPHPTVILLHGFPGNERNQDVAQAIRRAGANVFLFQYRGAWGSGGEFSFANAQDDVAAALTFLREPANASRLRIDPTRIALIGHSMGGWLALRGAASDDRVSCVAGLEVWDAGFDGSTLPHDQEERAGFVAYASHVSSVGGPLRTADGGEGLVRSLEVNAASWSLALSAPALKDKSFVG
jgi:uncharacterized protein